jgi:hypothetical protein
MAYTRASTRLSWVALWALGFVRASVRARTGGCGSGSSLSQVEAMTLENRENSDRTNVTVTNDANAADGMRPYNDKTAFIKVRFMTGNSKGFNVARAPKQFLAAAREQDDEFTI